MSQSRFGVLVDNAGGTEVRRNVVGSNGTGIAVRSLAIAPALPRGGVLVADNDVTDNRRVNVGGAPTEFAVRSGVWLAAAVPGDVVEGNRISGHDYGVLVTSFGLPSTGARVTGNQIWGSSGADIAWDGVGIGVCFQDNVGAGGGAPTSRPPMAETIYSCANPVTAGVPEPRVLADLAVYAAGGNAP
jgi:nitrous oxidase accessory protein NosD